MNYFSDTRTHTQVCPYGLQIFTYYFRCRADIIRPTIQQNYKSGRRVAVPYDDKVFRLPREGAVER